MSRTLFNNGVRSVDIEIQLISHNGNVDDLSLYFTELEIVEDITNLSLTGSLTYTDSQGIKEFLPIVGGETLKIKFKTADKFDEFLKTFIIIKLANETTTANGFAISKLYFSSDELLKNYEKKISFSWKSTGIDYIINDVFRNKLGSIKNIEIEPTQGAVDFVAPYLRPFDIIKILQNKSISKIYNDSGYLFYEDAKQYNFVSLSKLYDGNVYKTFEFNTGVRKDKNTVPTPEYIQAYNIIIGNDMIENIKQGQTGGTIYTFDYSTKSYMRKTIANIESYSQNYGKTLGNKMLFVKHYNNETAQISEFTQYINDRNTDAIANSNIIDLASRAYLSNARLYASINNNCIVINKDGDSGLRCGMVIFANYKSAAKEVIYDEKMAGKYLVRSVRHVINESTGYKQVCLIFKPGYEQDSTAILGDSR